MAREDILIQLAAARSSLDAAIRMLAVPEIQLPMGVERAADGACAHPMERRMQHLGGHWTCKDCGHHE